MKVLLALAACLATVAPAYAQYYPPPPSYPPPPPGYDRPPDYPPPGYGRPDYGDREFPRERFGRRCDSVLRTREGPRQLICEIIRPKPLGEECACPPPPGYDPDRFVPGVTIR